MTLFTEMHGLYVCRKYSTVYLKAKYRLIVEYTYVEEWKDLQKQFPAFELEIPSNPHEILKPIGNKD